jgi:hypothetical protein
MRVCVPAQGMTMPRRLGSRRGIARKTPHSTGPTSRTEIEAVAPSRPSDPRNDSSRLVPPGVAPMPRPRRLGAPGHRGSSGVALSRSRGLGDRRRCRRGDECQAMTRVATSGSIHKGQGRRRARMVRRLQWTRGVDAPTGLLVSWLSRPDGSSYPGSERLRQPAGNARRPVSQRASMPSPRIGMGTRGDQLDSSRGIGAAPERFPTWNAQT